MQLKTRAKEVDSGPEWVVFGPKLSQHAKLSASKVELAGRSIECLQVSRQRVCWVDHDCIEIGCMQQVPQQCLQGPCHAQM
eukprot:2545083-Amphidinium_carterae.2